MTWKMIRASRSSAPTPPPAPNSAQWRRIAQALGSGDDAAVARRLRVARAHVAHVRQALADDAPPAPVQLLADDVPSAGDDAPPVARVTPRPVVACANCGREGTPSPDRPDWCKACGAGCHEVRAAWSPPPRGPSAEAALELLARADDDASRRALRQAYLRARAADWGLRP